MRHDLLEVERGIEAVYQLLQRTHLRVGRKSMLEVSGYGDGDGGEIDLVVPRVPRPLGEGTVLLHCPVTADKEVVGGMGAVDALGVASGFMGAFHDVSLDLVGVAGVVNDQIARGLQFAPSVKKSLSVEQASSGV